MNNELNIMSFDSAAKAAFNEYVDGEFAALPSKDELSKKYPISKKSLRKAQRTIKVKKRCLPRPILCLKRVAFAAVAVIVVLAGMSLLDADVRGSAYNWAMQFFPTHVTFEFDTKPDKPTITGDVSGNTKSEIVTEAETWSVPEFFNKETVFDFEIGYIPEGFELSKSNEKSGIRTYTYWNKNGDYIFIGIYDAAGTSVSSEIEYSKYEELTLNGVTAHLFYNHTEQAGNIIMGNEDYVIICSSIISREELINIASNVK